MCSLESAFLPDCQGISHPSSSYLELSGFGGSSRPIIFMLDFSVYIYIHTYILCITNVQTSHLNINRCYKVSLQLRFIQIFKQKQHLMWEMHIKYYMERLTISKRILKGKMMALANHNLTLVLFSHFFKIWTSQVCLQWWAFILIDKYLRNHFERAAVAE